MKRTSPRVLPSLVVAAACALGSSAAAADDAQLRAAIASDQRSAEEKARDRYRHPYETLTFFGIRPDMTVVEVYPGGGWYTEILAPYLKEKGRLVAALYDRNPKTQKDWAARYNKQFTDRFMGKPERYGKIELSELVPPDRVDVAPAASVDLILDIRNAHNWINEGGDAVAAGWFKALKPGGVLGIVEHRMDADKPENIDSGYVHQQRIIDLMLKHGFELVATSEINSNPKDTKDHPEGVWTLPPSLALGPEKSAKYLAIGESDRMTLKFSKPVAASAVPHAG
ncbi:MAG TPA: methyltransferase [Myxococcota bacterium]|nr:methyltransferase [Myxococcota bacterium]